MRITDVVAIPLVHRLSKHFLGGTYHIKSRNTLITEVSTDAGVVGRAFGGDEEKYQSDVVGIIENYLKPLLVGEDPWNVEYLWERMFNAHVGLENRGLHTLDLANRAIQMQAIAAVDIALWDAIGKIANMPLYQLLGGYREKVPVIGIGGYYSPDKGDRELIEEVETYQKMELAGVKLKVGRAEIEEDARRVRLVRQTLGDNFLIACDANQAWEPHQAVRFANLVEDLNVSWLEEPVRWYDQLGGLRLVRQRTHIPVAAGQGEISRFGCRDLILNEAVDILNVDATLVGGVTEWKKVAALASLFEVKMAHHEEPQVAIHLLASIPHGFCVEIFPDPERDPLWFELPIERPRIKNGAMEVPKLPGLGIELNPEVVAKFSSRPLVR